MTNLEYRELRDLRKEREKSNELIGFVLCMQALSLALLIIIWVMILAQNAKAAGTQDLMSRIGQTNPDICEKSADYGIELQENTYLGSFRTTGYCNCTKCNGKWAYGPTASGVYPRPNHTVAVDPKVIPLGTHLLIDGREYVAEDTGGHWVQGNHIDIFYDDHNEAYAHGEQWAEVYRKGD